MLKIALALLCIGVACLAPDAHAATAIHIPASIALAATAAAVDPIFVSVAAAAEILATSRSQIYQRIARGELEAVKDGVRTKILYASLKQRAAELPKAQIKLYTPKPRVLP